MEQQTISIAKAGITTILNSRTSVRLSPLFSIATILFSPLCIMCILDSRTTVHSSFLLASQSTGTA
jgi:hypothetical protein